MEKLKIKNENKGCGGAFCFLVKIMTGAIEALKEEESNECKIRTATARFDQKADREDSAAP